MYGSSTFSPASSGHLLLTTAHVLLATSSRPPPAAASASLMRTCARLRKSSLALCIVARFLLTPSSEKAWTRAASGRTSSFDASRGEDQVAIVDGSGVSDDDDCGDQPMRATKLRSASGS